MNDYGRKLADSPEVSELTEKQEFFCGDGCVLLFLVRVFCYLSGTNHRAS